VLELDAKNSAALRGLADIHYDRKDHRQAIPLYERYLTLEPDDAAARTDLATMYLYAGDAPRAITTYQAVIRQHPTFLQAHYNLALTYHRQGDNAAALTELETARGLAQDAKVRSQIDDMIASLRGEKPASPAQGRGAGAGGGDTPERSPFQSAVEEAFRAHPIMGPRIVTFAWSGPSTGRVLVESFPMEGMPPAVREKFAARLGGELRAAQSKHGVDGPVRLEIADAVSGAVMATVTP
jgi:tetratricopeptide (TPR) repeat protein